jgi:hypothetical protein
VRIGRSALDEDAIRLIEQHNPHIDFDWTRILKGQDGPPEPRDAEPQERRGRPRDRDPRAAGLSLVRNADGGQTPVPIANAGQIPVPILEEGQTPMPTLGLESADMGLTGGESSEPAVHADGGFTPVEGWSADPVDETVQEVVAEFLIEPRVEPPLPRPQAGDALSAVETRLGSEGLSRIRARYSEVLARISETVSDPARQEELKAKAERLNPDTWVTEAEVGAGLEDYEAVFDSLRSVVGRRRRRSRRSSEFQRNSGAQQAPSASTGSTDAAEREDEEDEPGSAEQQ